jgi:hypothetical protein
MAKSTTLKQIPQDINSLIIREQTKMMQKVGGVYGYEATIYLLLRKAYLFEKKEEKTTL